jgi:hypothetical protein
MMFPRTMVVGELCVAVPIFGGRRRRLAAAVVLAMMRRIRPPAPRDDDAPTPVPEHARGIRRGRRMAASAAAVGRGRGRRRPVAAVRRRRRVGRGRGGEEVGRRNLPSPRVVAVRRRRGPGSSGVSSRRRRRRRDAAGRILPLRRIAAAAGVPSGILVVGLVHITFYNRARVLTEGVVNACALILP